MGFVKASLCPTYTDTGMLLNVTLLAGKPKVPGNF